MVKAIDVVTKEAPAELGRQVERQLRRRNSATHVDAAIAGKSAHVIAENAIVAASGGQLALAHERLQVSAVALCPAPVDHPEVFDLCVVPVAEAGMSDALDRELRAMQDPSSAAA